MPVGAISNEAELEAFIRDRLDNLGIVTSIQTLKSAIGGGSRHGVATVNFPNAVESTGLVVAHGLPNAPTVVLAGSIVNTGVFGFVHSIDDDDFTLVGHTDGSLFNGDVDFGWLAFGAVSG